MLFLCIDGRMGQTKYNRVLLKLSGESFCRPDGFGIDGEALESIAQRIAQICKLGPQVAIVVGGGNFLRGETFSKQSHIPQNTADYMGMLATVINACALQETLERLGQPTRVLSAIEVAAICEPFIRRRCLRHLELGRAAILAGGTGNPFFSTDTCAALRAADDPVANPEAMLIEKLSYNEVLQKGLRVIDPAAISLCSENNIPIVVLNIFKKGNITKALCGEDIGTLIS